MFFMLLYQSVQWHYRYHASKITVDLVIFACLNFREFLILNFFKIREIYSSSVALL